MAEYWFLARDPGSRVLEIPSNAVTEVLSFHLCTEQTDSSLLLVALLQELKYSLSLKSHCSGKARG